MRHATISVVTIVAAALIADPAAAGCCMLEHGAPRTQPLRGLIHQVAAWDLKCHEARTQVAVNRACARRDRLVDRVERMGWCWGSRDSDAALAWYYWLPCSKNRT